MSCLYLGAVAFCLMIPRYWGLGSVWWTEPLLTSTRRFAAFYRSYAATWSVRLQNTEIFDHRHPHCMARVGWSDQANYAQVRSLALRVISKNTVSQRVESTDFVGWVMRCVRRTLAYYIVRFCDTRRIHLDMYGWRGSVEWGHLQKTQGK